MIENVNVSKNPISGEIFDVRKYKGVASISILAINPDNDTLRRYGWKIADDAAEPKYTSIVERNGKMVKNARVRFLVQIQDLEDKPIIPLDFWCNSSIKVNHENTKCEVLDSYGRAVWATREDVKEHRIPQYTNGPANICNDYKPCHRGEKELVAFLFKFLNITPLQTFDRKSNTWVASSNPGRLTIDNWAAICDGNVNELRNDIKLMPDNRVKVILGVRTNEDNKTYQTFMTGSLKDGVFIGNGTSPARSTGEYAAARKAIDKFFDGMSENNRNSYSFSAFPVTEWKESASTVEDNSSRMFDTTEENTSSTDDGDDLPF